MPLKRSVEVASKSASVCLLWVRGFGGLVFSRGSVSLRCGGGNDISVPGGSPGVFTSVIGALCPRYSVSFFVFAYGLGLSRFSPVPVVMVVKASVSFFLLS